MSQFKVEVVPFTLEKHPNADSLSIAHVKGWQCIVRTDEFRDVKLGAYIPIDSVVPPTQEWEFMQSRHYRVKTIKLRKVLSQGILLPAREGWIEGQDVTEELGIKKYEPAEMLNIQFGGECAPEMGLFCHHTDIERIQNYPDVFTPDDEVVITEKVHGCVAADTRITMFDGSNKMIHNIKVGDIILGQDKTGKIVQTKVLNIYQNGITNNWLRISGKRRFAGGGNSFFAVYCTPDHRFMISNKYVRADKLKKGDKVSLIRTDISLTPLQEQIVLGKLLGDGYLHHSTFGASVEFGHKEDHVEYVKWTDRALGSISGRSHYSAISGFGTNMIRSRSTFNFWLKNKFNGFYKNGKKIVPNWVAKEITPLAIAVWYMDDGSLAHSADQEDRARFATCGFSELNCKKLIRCLNKFGINAVLQKRGKYFDIRLNSDDAEKLFFTISPYIIPCMQYKLPDRYRGSNYKLPSPKDCYKSAIKPQEINSIDLAPMNGKSKQRWDLETETHNYFANGILVHNCNARFALIGEDFYVGSHNHRKFYPGESIYAKIADKLQIENKMRALFRGDGLYMPFQEKPFQIVLYGEIYGKGVQKLNYGRDDQSLAIFDIEIDEVFQDWMDVKNLTMAIGLQVVPHLYIGKYSDDLVKVLTDGPSMLDPKCNREGIVIRSLEEDFHPGVGRKWLKSISTVHLLKEE